MMGSNLPRIGGYCKDCGRCEATVLYQDGSQTVKEYRCDHPWIDKSGYDENNEVRLFVQPLGWCSEFVPKKGNDQ